MNSLLTESEAWYIVQAYFEKYGTVRHQIESFDNFMTTSLPHIIQESSEIVLNQGTTQHIIALCNVSVQKPVVQECDGFDRPIMPHMARMRSITYASSIMVDVVHDIKSPEKHERRVFREVLLCKLPVMVGSSYCHTYKADRVHECRLDHGGYFIINGIEKALLAQEKLHTNQAYIFNVKQPSKYQLVCEIRSCHELKMRSTSTLYLYITNTKKGATPEMVANLPFIDMHIPILALFKLLSVNTRDDALKLIVGDLDAEESRLLCGILDNDTTADMSTEELLDWLGREGTKEPTKERRMKYLEHIITNELLPHMGLVLTDEVNRAKACYLGFMVRKIIAAYTGQIQCDDRDHYANKRIDTAGTLMSLLFRQVYRTYLKTLTAQVNRVLDAKKLEYTNLGDMINHKKITGAFKYAFSTGNWGIQRGNTAQSGVAQMMSRMTSVAAISNLRRINTPINREGKAPKPRQLHYTSWGIVCPVETPEGTSCGLVKNLAMMTHVRIGTYSGAIKEQLNRIQDIILIPLLKVSDNIRANGVPIIINGTIYMYTQDEFDGRKLLTRLRELRRKSLIPFDASLSYIDGALCVDSDPGCLLRPLIVASKLNEIRDLIACSPSYEHLWEHLLSHGAIEYVDKQEEIDLRVGISVNDPGPEYTHYEIHASLINGLVASLIVFPDHNQAPRNCYQSAMGKQAVGIYSLNYHRRMDAVSHILCTPQKPLVTTRMDEILHTSEAPTGINAMVVIMCYTGFNQEDSLIINQEALDRGLFRSVKFQTYKDEERTNGADAEKFENPTKVNCSGLRVGCYDKLEDDGTLPIGTDVHAGDVIIGKTITTTEIGEGTRRAVKRDRSIMIKHSEEATIDAVMQSKNRDGSLLMKVRTRKTRTPVVGDKLCYDQDTEILTDRGWLPVSKVQSDDKALVYDPVTKYMAYETIQYVHHYPPEEQDMYVIQSQLIDLMVTMNHKMYVKNRSCKDYELIEAKDIFGKRVSYLKNCENGLLITEDPPNPTKGSIHAWLYLFGFWIGDGWTENHTSYGGKRKRHTYRTTIAQVKPHTKERLLKSIEECGLHAVENGDKIHIYFKELTKLLEPLSTGAPNKKLPDWCFKLSVEHSRRLLDGLLDSDGNYNNSGAASYSTSSVCLKDDIQRIALHAGWSANSIIYHPKGSVSLLKERVITSKYDQWRIGIIKKKNSPTVNHGHVHEQHIQNEEIVKYNGSVHCITVRTGIIQVRRNGKTVWCGNSSRHGQKGVIGTILSAADMPFTKEGIQPDIIVNPHAIPSRMTIGQLMECLLGKLCCVKGCQGDATPFRGVSIKHISAELEAHGYDGLGEEVMYNGMTGQQLEGKVFIGPTYYQRLKHMVADKHHSRSRGPVQILTRQPVEGRAREGGLRFGEMERDCFTEEHQILTNSGFMFLKDIEACDREALRIASYDMDSKEIVYEPMNELIVNPYKTRTMIEMTQYAESYRWGENSDPYGRSPATRARASKSSSEIMDYTLTGKPKEENIHSNFVSLVMTPKHQVIYKTGKSGQRKSHERAGDNYVIWNGYEKTSNNRAIRKRYENPYETHLASEMMSDDPNKVIKMMASASNGIRLETVEMPFVDDLHLENDEQITAFLELYGYWLGYGSLNFKPNTIVFTVVKKHDIKWLYDQFDILQLSSNTRTDKNDYQYTIEVKTPSWVDYFHSEYKTKYHKSGNFVSSECKSAKWFMHWVWKLDKPLLRNILSGLRRADGCESKGNNRIYTSSISFRDEIVQVCLHAGYAARFVAVYLEGEERGIGNNGIPIVANHTSWAITYPDPDSRNSHYSRPILYCKRDVKEIIHTGRTWCVNVPPRHTIIVRRATEHNGIVTKVSTPIITNQCVISHGSANFISERLFEQSDPFIATVCGKCGLLAHPAADKTLLRNKKAYCNNCKSSDNVHNVRMPYAFKLLLQELMAMNIATRLSLKQTPEGEVGDIYEKIEDIPQNIIASFSEFMKL
jgi:DNA-directed RNA polymerase II subunit RPB2